MASELEEMSVLKNFEKSFTYGGHTVTLSTGNVARQADASVWVNMEETVVLAALTARREALPNQSFLPLTINYQERAYAGGKIPGGFFKREGRPSEKEILTSRLIDRPLRPLFPKNFFHEVQIIATVVSLNPQIDASVPALLGASAAAAISGVPVKDILGAARVGMVDGQLVLNPTAEQIAQSQLNMVVAGTEKAILMVEAGAHLLSEEQMLDAVVFGHEQMQITIQAIRELAQEAGKPKWDWQPKTVDQELRTTVSEKYAERIEQANSGTDRLERKALLQKIYAEVDEECSQNTDLKKATREVCAELDKKCVRNRVLDGKSRIDGRTTRTVRDISIETGLLPRAHGSALFTRGETQVLSATTLGTSKEAQIIDAIDGDRRDRFMLHYNFPPYCVGETGFLGIPKRREIGHGHLAKRALEAVMPNEEEFPYVLRAVCETTESNGSSSMASVCATTLSLMNAGVPIKAKVAGIAMGLVLEGDRFAVLTDILGDEDHLGDMDFKVAGTRDGITALQMDIKVDGTTGDILHAALAQAHTARMEILDIMDEKVGTNLTISPYAPRLTQLKINPKKIRDVIGKGGAVIRSITEETGVEINIDDDGTITISSSDVEATKQAQQRIADLTAEVEVGMSYPGRVAKIMEYGAFVTVLPGKDGLLHISQMGGGKRVRKVEDVLSEGDSVEVHVLEIDRRGKIRLTMSNPDQEQEQSSTPDNFYSPDYEDRGY